MNNKKVEQADQKRDHLVVDKIMSLKPLDLPDEAIRDGKKMTRFLEDVEKTINRLIIGVQ